MGHKYCFLWGFRAKIVFKPFFLCYWVKNKLRGFFFFFKSARTLLHQTEVGLQLGLVRLGCNKNWKTIIIIHYYYNFFSCVSSSMTYKFTDSLTDSRTHKHLAKVWFSQLLLKFSTNFSAFWLTFQLYNLLFNFLN